jgi:ubiquinone/menaquinone biosynthesis C-methylase UbiE
VFPVVGAVPRLLPESLAAARGALEPHRGRGERALWARVDAASGVEDPDFARRFAHTRDSFSSEWAMVRDGDRAWGLDVAARRVQFGASFALDVADLRGRTLLEAGCGHGEVVLALAGTGVEVFAIDMSSAVDSLRDRLAAAGASEAVHLVQGNVHALPFRERAFDLVHSAGVLHHTPDTREGFRIVSRRVKPGGRCYIEVYSAEKKNPLAHGLVTALRGLTVHLPHPLLHGLCFAAAPLLWAFSRAYNAAAGLDVYRVRSLRECELSLFDGFSPRYAHHHRTEEVEGWFAEQGFTSLCKTYEHKNGFGIMGVRPATAAP